MARAVIRIPQPKQPPDGDPVWVKAEIERAADSAGVPGAFANIATVVINLFTSPSYEYEDASGAATSWYRYRFTDVAVGAWSNYSEEVQVNSARFIIWLLDDIPDADISASDFEAWAQQSLYDMWTQGIWLPIARGIIPHDGDGDGLLDEYYDVPAELYEVCRVERVMQRRTKTITAASNATPIVVTSAAHGFAVGDLVYIESVLGNDAANGAWYLSAVSTNTFTLRDSVGDGAYTSGGTVRKSGDRHISWRYSDVEWQQNDRRIRFLDLGSYAVSPRTPTVSSSRPVSTYDYVLHGKQRFRDITELRDEYWMFFYWLIRQKYLAFRQVERANRARFIVFNDQDDVTERALAGFIARADIEVASRLGKLLPADYPQDLAPANMMESS